METSIYYAFQSHQIPTVFQTVDPCPAGWLMTVDPCPAGWLMNEYRGWFSFQELHISILYICIYIYIFHSGGLGAEGVFARRCVYVRNRPQPSAVVRKPFAWEPCGRAYGKFCRRGHFWRFQTSRCFVSRGRRGTSWHSDVFCNVSKVVLCGRPNTFADVFVRWVAVFVAGAALWTCPSSFCLAGAAL